MHFVSQRVRNLFSLGLLVFIASVATAALQVQNTVVPSSAPKKEFQSKPATKSSKTKATSATRPVDETGAPLPTNAEVESFLHRMFGYNPAATWKIINILPSEAPHVAHVIVVFGDNQTATHIYVTADGDHAVVGDMIPFGADPFAQIRARLMGAKGFTKGDAAAPVTIIEFSDLQCPHCKLAQPIIDKLLQEMPNTSLVFQPFPLAMHKWALKAALYGQCVGEQNPDSFWRFVQKVYDAQEAVNEANADEKLAALVKEAGADSHKAAACAARPETLVQVQESIELGKSVGVGGTPTVFINGRKISAIKEVPFELLKAMVKFDATEGKNK